MGFLFNEEQMIVGVDADVAQGVSKDDVFSNLLIGGVD